MGEEFFKVLKILPDAAIHGTVVNLIEEQRTEVYKGLVARLQLRYSGITLNLSAPFPRGDPILFTSFQPENGPFTVPVDNISFGCETSSSKPLLSLRRETT